MMGFPVLYTGGAAWPQVSVTLRKGLFSYPIVINVDSRCLHYYIVLYVFLSHTRPLTEIRRFKTADIGVIGRKEKWRTAKENVAYRSHTDRL
jgi:hypothetical protein